MSEIIRQQFSHLGLIFQVHYAAFAAGAKIEAIKLDGHDVTALMKIAMIEKNHSLYEEFESQLDHILTQKNNERK